MKRILLLLTLLVACKAEKDHPFILQKTDFYDGQYVLTTSVYRNREQKEIETYYDFSIYRNYITGSFEYIKQSKLAEYNKADSILKKYIIELTIEKKIKQKELMDQEIRKDSINILNNIPVNTGSYSIYSKLVDSRIKYGDTSWLMGNTLFVSKKPLKPGSKLIRYMGNRIDSFTYITDKK